MGDADREWKAYLANTARVGLVITAAVVSGMGVEHEAAVHGIGISPDSVDYIQEARRLAEPGGLARLGSGGAFVDQPPLYPLLLAGLAGLHGEDPIDLVPGLNDTLRVLSTFVGIVLLMAAGNGGRMPRAPVLLFAVISLLTARSLHEVFGMAWSEPLFILLSIGTLLTLIAFLVSGQRSSLWAAGGLAALAVLTRYSGVAFVAAGALGVLLAGRGDIRERLRDALVFAAPATATFAAWMLRNQLVSDTLLGHRDPALYSLAENTARFLALAQAHWLPATAEIGAAAKLAVAGALVGALAWLVAPHFSAFRAKLAEDRAVLVPCVAFAGVYAAFTVVTSSLVAYDPIDFRLFAPAFVPLWAVVVLGFDAILRVGASRVRTFAVAAVLAALLIAPVRQFVADFVAWRDHGRQLARAEWTESPTVAWLRDWPALHGDRPVYSNMRVAVTWFTGAGARNVPSRTPCAGRTGEAARSCFFDHADPALLDSYWVQFDAARYPYHYTLDEIASWVEIETVVETADGRVVRITGRRRPPG